jgi:hypothetical protein
MYLLWIAVDQALLHRQGDLRPLKWRGECHERDP